MKIDYVDALWEAMLERYDENAEESETDEPDIRDNETGDARRDAG